MTSAYPSPPPQPYADAALPPPVVRNGLGTAALVFAIIGLVLFVSILGGVVFGIIAVIVGVAARGRVKRGEANNGGVAIAGIVLGSLAIVSGLVFAWIVYAALIDTGTVDCLNNAGQDNAKMQQCADEFIDKLGGGSRSG